MHPEVVNIDDEGNYSVSYDGLTPFLIEGMNEQQAEIEELKELVQQLLGGQKLRR